jgi:hypothetical protein
MTLPMGRNQSRLCALLEKQRGTWSYPDCYWRIQGALKFVLCIGTHAIQNGPIDNSFHSKNVYLSCRKDPDQTRRIKIE